MKIVPLSRTNTFQMRWRSSRESCIWLSWKREPRGARRTCQLHRQLSMWSYHRCQMISKHLSQTKLQFFSLPKLISHQGFQNWAWCCWVASADCCGSSRLPLQPHKCEGAFQIFGLMLLGGVCRLLRVIQTPYQATGLSSHKTWGLSPQAWPKGQGRAGLKIP